MLKFLNKNKTEAEMLGSAWVKAEGKSFEKLSELTFPDPHNKLQ